MSRQLIIKSASVDKFLQPAYQPGMRKSNWLMPSFLKFLLILRITFTIKILRNRMYLQKVPLSHFLEK